MILIGLCGPKGVGKSTVAARLEELHFERLSFAAPLKAMLTAMFHGVPGTPFERLTSAQKEQPIPLVGVTPRRLMQTLGTEWGRHLIDRDIWLKIMRAKLADRRRPEFTGPSAQVVIDDVRYDNEAALIKEMGGHVVAVTRHGFRRCRKDRHETESGVHRNFIDTTLNLGKRVPGTARYNGAVLRPLLPYLGWNDSLTPAPTHAR